MNIRSFNEKKRVNLILHSTLCIYYPRPIFPILSLYDDDDYKYTTQTTLESSFRLIGVASVEGFPLKNPFSAIFPCLFPFFVQDGGGCESSWIVFKSF